eukprot:TRINITY_DN16283_c0_g2_i2.p1 TRINITY_DN16283_c0_g2~~TRINITY_DN16283_c0_g2_i2.p1  ORF type:complete len:830 (+),score=162.23 TRINITY_DN16283_c0_g2_i2:84-2492(+)
MAADDADDIDAFFDELLNEDKPPATAKVAPPVPASVASGASSTPSASAAAPAPKSVGADAKAAGVPASTAKASPSVAAVPPAAKAASAASSTEKKQVSPKPSGIGADGLPVKTFALDTTDHDAEGLDTSAAHSDYVQDCRFPEVPEPPEDFSEEDCNLRDALVEFYLRHRAGNLTNVNLIVIKYRGVKVSHLWAQLIMKYGLPCVDAIELMGRTIYRSSPFEHPDHEAALTLVGQLEELQEGASEVLSGADSGAIAELFHKAIELGNKTGSDSVLRFLCFRGIPTAKECTLADWKLRAQTWKVILGYLPMDRSADWSAICGEKRGLYASYKSDIVEVNDDNKVTPVKKAGEISSEAEELLSEIMNDVERTRQDVEMFRQPATRSALVSLLMVYARLNPGVRYVQGMNEVAAVIFYVMASADPDFAEADAFWCFSELMVEIKEGFMQAMDDSHEGVHALVEGVTRLLRTYDPELARHLHQSELPPFVWAFRWCTLLFSQDASLPDVLRLWDSFIADPRRFEFVVHVAVSAVLGKRDELLRTDKQFALAEVLQGAPRGQDVLPLVRRAWAICAFERREQTPPFPSTAQRGKLDDFVDLADAAVTRALEVQEQVRRNIQENIAPVVQETAGNAAAAAVTVASDGAQAMKTWLEDTAPARKEAYSKAQTRISGIWNTVRATGQTIAAEVTQKERVDAAAAGLNTAKDSAAMAAAAVGVKASALWTVWSGVAASGEDNGCDQGQEVGGESERKTSGGYTHEETSTPLAPPAPPLASTASDIKVSASTAPTETSGAIATGADGPGSEF